MPFIAFQTIRFKCLGTDATKPLNFNKRQSPRPLFNVVSPFSSALMCFGLSNIDWVGGGGEREAVLCVTHCNDSLIQSKTIHVFQQHLKVIVVTA
jgi:hypothetical protein